MGVAHSDGIIHCLKPGGAVHSAAEGIAIETFCLNNNDSDDDPFPATAGVRGQPRIGRS